MLRTAHTKGIVQWFFVACLGAIVPVAEVLAQQVQPPAPQGVVTIAGATVNYVRLGLPDVEALLFQPTESNPRGRIALIFAHPSGNSFQEPPGPELARRGHPILIVNYRGPAGEPEDSYAPAISQGIRFLRSLPGVERVVLVGHSGGGHLTAFYQNVAENGPSACTGSEKIYPCRAELVANLQKPDGLVLLDPTLGAFHQASSIDPAIGSGERIGAVDMFAPSNGYDPASGAGHYSMPFVQRFHSAQAERNSQIVALALDRLRLIKDGRGDFSDDEPFVVRGMGVTSAGARLYQPDVALLSRTQRAHVLIKGDGSTDIAVIESIRPPLGRLSPQALSSLGQMTQNTTVRRFLGSNAIRIGPEFAITANNILGVDWASAISSTPANAEGIRAPTLLLTMSCHYLVVPGEIVFDHLAAHDKTYASIEGATHVFTPCKPEYGDTVKRTFDTVADWLDKEGRF